MPVQIQHTVSKIVKKVAGTVTDTVTEIFPEVNGKFPQSVAISITNTDAADVLYMQAVTNGTANSLTTTVFDEKIPVLESRQFQFERPHPIDPTQTMRIYLLGAAAGTTYTATLYL